MKKFKIFIILNSISFCIFSIISYLSVMISLLSRTGSEKPICNLGFPKVYYEQFYISSNELRWGWDHKAFMIDYAVAFAITAVGFLINKKLKHYYA